MDDLRLEGGAAALHPTSVPELSPSEQTLLWTLRRLVLGTEDWPVVERELCRTLGQMDGLWTMRGCIGFVSRMARGARRRMRCHRPCCASLAPDEVSMLIIVSAAYNGDMQLARMVAGWMVQPSAVESLLDSAILIGEHMEKGGKPLPSRGMPHRPCPTREWIGQQTIH